MDAFIVAMSGDFFDAGGRPCLPGFDPRGGLGERMEVTVTGAGPAIAAPDVEEAHGLILLASWFTRDSVPASRRLAVIARFGVGYDTVDLDACNETAIAVVIGPDGVRRPVAASIVTFVLALTTRLFDSV